MMSAIKKKESTQQNSKEFLLINALSQLQKENFDQASILINENANTRSVLELKERQQKLLSFVEIVDKVLKIFDLNVNLNSYSLFDPFNIYLNCQDQVEKWLKKDPSDDPLIKLKKRVVKQPEVLGKQVSQGKGSFSVSPLQRNSRV